MHDSVSDKFADWAMERSIDLLRVAEGSRAKILRVLEQLVVDLELQLVRTGGEGVTPNRRRRIEGTITRAKRIIANSYRTADKVLAGEMMDLADIVGKDTLRVMSGVLSRDLVSGGFTKKQLQAMVKETIVQGAPASDWWQKQSANTQQRLASQMRIGYLAGETNDQIVRRIRGRAVRRVITTSTGRKIIVKEYQDGVIAASTREANALVRTSMQSIANEARMETYHENEDLIEAVQALVTLDDRTSTICQARSGGVWDIKTGEPTKDSATQESFPGPPPWHYNCRSTLIPVTKSWDTLIEEASRKRSIPKDTVKELPESTQSSMDGQVAGKLNYEDWLRKKEESNPGFAKQVLGPTKGRLFLEGKLSLSQMIDQRGRPLSVKELVKKLDN